MRRVIVTGMLAGASVALAAHSQRFASEARTPRFVVDVVPPR